MDDVRGRVGELAELEAFACSHESYRWVIGPPGSGKTALAERLAAHPPGNVDVVAFFASAPPAGRQGGFDRKSTTSSRRYWARWLRRSPERARLTASGPVLARGPRRAADTCCCSWTASTGTMSRPRSRPCCLPRRAPTVTFCSSVAPCPRFRGPCPGRTRCETNNAALVSCCLRAPSPPCWRMVMPGRCWGLWPSPAPERG